MFLLPYLGKSDTIMGMCFGCGSDAQSLAFDRQPLFIVIVSLYHLYILIGLLCVYMSVCVCVVLDLCVSLTYAFFVY